MVGRGRPTGEEDRGSNAGSRDGRRDGASMPSVDLTTDLPRKGEASMLEGVYYAVLSCPVLSCPVLWVGVLDTRSNARCRVKWSVAMRDRTRLSACAGGMGRCRGGARRQKAYPDRETRGRRGRIAIAG